MSKERIKLTRESEAAIRCADRSRGPTAAMGMTRYRQRPNRAPVECAEQCTFTSHQRAAVYIGWLASKRNLLPLDDLGSVSSYCIETDASGAEVAVSLGYRKHRSGDFAPVLRYDIASGSLYKVRRRKPVVQPVAKSKGKR